MRNGLKKTMALLTAVLMLLAVLPASAGGTEQYSDSVQPGISLASILDPETAVATYVFMNGEEEISRQAVKNGDTLVEPEVTTGPNEKFIGWDPVVNFGVVTGVEATETITVQAKIEKVYYVFFKDSVDGRVVATKEGITGDTISDFSDVTFAVASDESITGWKNEAGEVVPSVTIADQDITLTAVVEKGYWIAFNSNAGSYVAPQFYVTGTTAVAPANPTKPGFEFAGWYTDEGLTMSVNFGSITTNTTVYAKWTATPVQYTVIHWWENADNDDYSYRESESRMGNAGTQTTASAKQYNGLTAQTVTQGTIAGDGSTIVNVYYKRNVYEVNFYEKQLTCTNTDWWHIHWSGCYSWVASHTIKAKYGANIKDQWPGGAWYVSQTGSTAQTNLQVMPLGGKNYYRKQSGDRTFTAYYYVEVLPDETGAETVTVNGRTYKLDHVDRTTNNENLTVTEEEYYDITGFTCNKADSTQIKKDYNNSKFYYTRNSYEVVYVNNGTIESRISYKYEADISGAGTAYVPADPPAGKEGFVFDGWYADPTGVAKYDFTGKTMRAENITVYAKWVAPVHTVTVYNANKTAIVSVIQDIPLGEKISEEDMPTIDVPEGSRFLGWVNLDDGKPFSFDTEIRQDYRLYPRIGSKDSYTVVYDGNGATGGKVPTDTAKYADGASADVKLPGDLSKTDCVFLGWSSVPNATTAEYQPGSAMVIRASDATNGIITLYAVWGPKPATTTLTYDANYPGAASRTVRHLENDSATLPNNAAITLYSDTTFIRPGYKLIGWANDATAEKPDYACGAKVLVDNSQLAPDEENILYAVWERSTVDVTLTKQVMDGPANKAFDFTVTSTEAIGADSAYALSNENKTATFSLSDEGSVMLKNVPIGATLTVTEDGADDYTTTAACGDEVLNVTDGTDGQKTFELTVPEHDVTIAVTNTIKTGSLTVAKLVTGNMGDRTKKFEFRYSYTLNGVEHSDTFNLANGKTTGLKDLPYGTEVTITETEYADYTTTYTIGEATGATSGREAKVTIGKPTETVTFTNYKEAIPDTGVLLDSLPYVLILACVIAIGAVAFVRKRRRGDDE